MTESDSRKKPLDLIAELTHRCPLGCPYCRNPIALEPREQELDAATWARVFAEAAALGVKQAHLSGGEPGARRDLVDIAAHAREAGLSTRLVTSGVGIATRTMRDLWEAGLEHVQVSFQDAQAVSSDHIAGHRGAFQRKCALAAEAVRLGLPLTVEVVVHRANIARLAAMVDLALALKAARLALVPVQYRGWALRNRAALTPSSEQRDRVAANLESLRRRHLGRIVIEMPGDGGDVSPSLRITPSGRVLLSAGTNADAEVWNIRDHSLAEICAHAAVPVAAASCERPDRIEAAEAEPQPGYVYRRM